MSGLQPLSDMQESMLVHEAIEGEPIYNACQCFTITGKLDVDALGNAIQAVARRHAVLLSTYHLEDGKANTGAAALPELQTPKRWADFWTRPFDLEQESPLRIGLTEDGDEHTLGLCVHHVACDTWSIDILLRDIGTAYNALARGGVPTWTAEAPSFFDYAARERARNWDTRWWSELLAGIEPSNYPRTDALDVAERGRCHRLPLPLDSTHTQKVRRLAQTERLSPTAILFTAISFAVNAPILGVPTVLRDTAALQQTVGPLLTMLPVVTTRERGLDRTELIRRHAEALDTAIQHKDVPYSRIVGTQPTRPNAPLFLHTVNVDSMVPRLGLAGLRVTRVPIRPALAVWPAVWEFSRPTVGNLRGELSVSLDAFTHQQAQTLVEDFLASLDRLLHEE